MHSKLLVAALLMNSSLAFGQSCPDGQIFNSCDGPQFGPGPCIPGCIVSGNPPPSNEPTGPSELCIREECRSVAYSWMGNIAIAESELPNGYRVLGWAGPCANADRSCPDILNQAFNDLRTNALRANRAQEAE